MALRQVVGKVAKFNPIKYGAQTEASFSHRKMPEVPPLEIQNPFLELVSAVNIRAASLLGYSKPKFIPRPVLIATQQEEVSSIGKSLTSFEQESTNWTWGAKEETQGENIVPGKMSIFSWKTPNNSEVLEREKAILAAKESLFVLSRDTLKLFLCMGVDVTRRSIGTVNDRVHRFHEKMAARLQPVTFTGPRTVEMIRIRTEPPSKYTRGEPRVYYEKVRVIDDSPENTYVIPPGLLIVSTAAVASSLALVIGSLF